MIEFLKRYYFYFMRRSKANWHTLRNGTNRERFMVVARVAIYCLAFFLILGSLTFALVALSLPDPNKLNDREVAQSTKIFARDGTTLLYEVHGEYKRTLIDPKDLPKFVGQATISIEDKNFYKNPGVDWRGIVRSLYIDITNRSASQGGSTITQQFVRNAILTREKSITRKIKEAVLAIEIGQKYSKDEILKLYLNEIPYGQNAYGVQAASLTYFGIDAKNLDLAQAAYLASLPQAPTFYSNPSNRQRLDARHELVLTAMYDQGYITKEQMEAAKNEVVVFSKTKDTGPNFAKSAHFVSYIQQQLADRYGQKTLEEGGLNVVTTLDWHMQEAADQAVKDGVAHNTKANKANNAGLVAMDPKTGQILAMIGSADYFNDDIDGQVNVTLRPLQPGSSFKPYVYATAFKQGMSPATMIVDVKTSFGTYGGKDYSPTNYDGQNHGIVNIRKALAGSLNVPAVKTLSLVGVQNAIDTAKDMGITSDINSDKCGLSLVLGGCEITLIDHTAAMGVFANMGTKHEAAGILKVTDSKGKVLEEWQQDSGSEALDPQVAYEIVNIMTDNNARAYVFGANSPLILPDRVVAAKTGTTQAWKDGWTMGYTPSLVAGVWTGNTNGSPMRAGADGVVTAGPIWHQFMLNALKGTPAETFQEPPGIQHIQVDAISGKLPTQYTPSTKEEVFASFAIPTGFDDVHIAEQINKLNGKLANSQTPSDQVESRVFTVIHSEQPDNPNWEAPVVLWARSAGYNNAPTEQDDGSTTGSTQSQIRFMTPAAGQEINSLPFLVQVDVGSNDVTSVDFNLDGIPAGSKDASPFALVISSARNGTNQTLMATAHLRNGSLISASIPVNINVKK